MKIPLEINNISAAAQNLLKKLLVKDQFKRIDWFELLQYDITEAGYIIEKKSADAKLEELKEILSLKHNGSSYGQHATEQDDYLYKKISDVSSNSSGSKVVTTATPHNPFARHTKVASFEEKATFERKGKEEPRKNIDSNGDMLTATTSTTNTKVFSSPNIVKKNSLPASYGITSKRRTLLDEHNHCTSGIRLAINMLKED